jgi:hypothetical protein
MADYDSRLPIRIGDENAVEMFIATDGTAKKNTGIEVYGQDGTNNQAIKTDTTGRLEIVDVNATTDTEDGAVAAGQTLPAHIGLGYGYNGADWERLETDGNGALDTTITTALPAGTNNIGDIGTIVDLEATDGSAALTKGIQVLGTDGTNAQILSTDSTGRVVTANQTAGTATFEKITDGTNTLDVTVEGAAVPNNGIMAHAEDSSGNAAPLNLDSAGNLKVATTTLAEQLLVDIANANLVKDTVTTVNSYTPSATTDKIKRVSVSGSGLMKVELFWGTTSSEVLKDVKFNSSANPNVEFALEDYLILASTETILVKCTNLENRASPGSDFTGYCTFYYVD